MTDINSPCIRNCCLDATDICLGCFRSIEEIKQWSSANDIQKQQILYQTSERKNKRELEGL